MIDHGIFRGLCAIVRNVHKRGLYDYDSDPYRLTRTELVVAVLLANGLNNYEIAEVRGVNHETISSHVKSLILKTHSESRTQVAAKLIRSGAIRYEWILDSHLFKERQRPRRDDEAQN